MPHATVREIVLGILDRQIRDAEEASLVAQRRRRWQEFACKQCEAEKLRRVRAALAKQFPGNGGAKRA